MINLETDVIFSSLMTSQFPQVVKSYLSSFFFFLYYFLMYVVVTKIATLMVGGNAKVAVSSKSNSYRNIFFRFVVIITSLFSSFLYFSCPFLLASSHFFSPSAFLLFATAKISQSFTRTFENRVLFYKKDSF